jgi:hypothetical protein
MRSLKRLQDKLITGNWYSCDYGIDNNNKWYFKFLRIEKIGENLVIFDSVSYNNICGKWVKYRNEIPMCYISNISNIVLMDEISVKMIVPINMW